MNKVIRQMRYLHFNADAKHFEIQQTDIPTPNEDQYLVRVLATCLNRVDLLEKNGKYNAVKDNKILGIEFVGIPVDQKTLMPLSKGPRIVGGIVKGGSYAQYSLISKAHTFEFDFPIKSFDMTPKFQSSTPFSTQIKDFFFDMASEQIKIDIYPQLTEDIQSFAAIPEAFMTAYQLLQYYGKLKPGACVYIPAGAGGIGTAAIQLAKHYFKSRVITTCSGNAKEELCNLLGADLVLNYKNLSDDELLSKINNFTNGKGVDCILDCIGPSKAHFHAKIISEDGHWILYGLLGGAKAPCDSLMSEILFKRVHLIGSLLRNRNEEYKKTLVQDVSRDIFPLFKAGIIKPIIGARFFLDTENYANANIMDEAHELMEKNISQGRIIVFIK